MPKGEKMETFGVTFTPEKLEAFNLAIQDNIARDSFVFEGKTWDTQYARYLSAYVTGVFMAGRDKYKHP